MGFWIPTGLSIDGTYAGHDVNTDIQVPYGVTWYAPTMIPPDVNNSGHVACVETVTIHRWNFGTEHAWGLWDQCNAHTWFVYKKMDATWLNTYTRTFDGELRFFTQVVKLGTSWQGYLYNFNSAAWELQGSVVGGTTPCCWPGGWTMWESFGTASNGCPDSKSVRAAPVQIRFTSGVWQNLTPAYSSTLSNYNSCIPAHYRFILNQANYDWQVNYFP